MEARPENDEALEDLELDPEQADAVTGGAGGGGGGDGKAYFQDFLTGAVVDKPRP
jgi:hypothetical protein